MGSLKSSILKVVIRTAMFLAYLFAGAGIFLLLEKDEQHMTRKNALDMLNNYERQLMNSTQAVADQDLKHLRKLVEEAVDVGAIGKRQFLTKWNLGNAFFFCGNVITTIGKIFSQNCLKDDL